MVWENLPELRGVRFLIKQLFSNLLYNSLKFTSDKRAPRITISASKGKYRDEKRDYHIIEFRDNGIGFDPIFNEKVFKIFTRLQHSPGPQSGSGIGLALCKKIMETHKGHITAHGNMDEGVAFRMYFPV